MNASKKIVLSIILFFSIFSIFAQNAETENNQKFNIWGSGTTFKLDPLTDGILLGTTGTLAATMFITSNLVKVGRTSYDGTSFDKSDVPGLDRLFMNSYSKGLDITATILEVTALASPIVFLSVSNEEWLTIGVMYAETIFMAYGLKELGKMLVHRTRPYMYYSDYPSKEADNGDWQCSFPSGHTTMTFASAAFTSYVFFKYFPDSPWRWAVLGGSYTIAVTTACLRMASGNHFFTDVLTGMVIGTASGLLVPWLHTRRLNSSDSNQKGFSADISPLGFNLKVSF